MKKQSGFTLIELMVVMAIIAILATAGLTAYSNYLKKARDSSRLQVARQLMTTVENLSNGGRVPTGEALIAFLEGEGGFTYVLPKMNPLIARVSGLIDNTFGTAFALPDLDPLSGAPQCISGWCGFIYFRYTDNTYLIGYGIEHFDSAQNFKQFVNPSNQTASNVYNDYTSSETPAWGQIILTPNQYSWSGNFVGTNEEVLNGGGDVISPANNANIYLIEATLLSPIPGNYVGS